MLSKLDIINMQLSKNLGNHNSLLELITNHKTVLFSINSLMYPKLASGVEK
ncbi:hypothetical protein [Spiroplasma endosymbiont of Agriotes lineatus]|uniref:hypothetical protein n=1 Tax=Spiroplasma endosymbiont of Agriotes lineatus TaxID=3077930 RepID=UPI0030CCDBA0